MDRYDPYPKFTRDDMEWFNKMLCLVVGNPKDVLNIGRRRGGLDLEIVFDIAPASRHLFTPGVCRLLGELVKQRTGALAPVVYEVNQPHAAAQEAVDYAAGS